MQKAFIFIFIFLILSCKPSTVVVSELTIIDNKYYRKQPQELFTGFAVTKFKNGRISNFTEFKGGIPNGIWFAYGYKGDILQEGRFFPVQLREPFIIETNIKRLNISFWKEGNYSFIDVFVIRPFFYIDVSDTIKLKKETEQLLRQKNLIGKDDSITNLYVVTGELE